MSAVATDPTYFYIISEAVDSKIAAIKMVRAEFNFGLKMSKDICDTMVPFNGTPTNASIDDVMTKLSSSFSFTGEDLLKIREFLDRKADPVILQRYSLAHLLSPRSERKLKEMEDLVSRMKKEADYAATRESALYNQIEEMRNKFHSQSQRAYKAEAETEELKNKFASLTINNASILVSKLTGGSGRIDFRDTDGKSVADILSKLKNDWEEGSQPEDPDYWENK